MVCDHHYPAHARTWHNASNQTLTHVTHDASAPNAHPVGCACGEREEHKINYEGDIAYLAANELCASIPSHPHTYTISITINHHHITTHALTYSLHSHTSLPPSPLTISDAVKLDGCGRQRNLTFYAELMQVDAHTPTQTLSHPYTLTPTHSNTLTPIHYHTNTPIRSHTHTLSHQHTYTFSVTRSYTPYIHTCIHTHHTYTHNPMC